MSTGPHALWLSLAAKEMLAGETTSRESTARICAGCDWPLAVGDTGMKARRNRNHPRQSQQQDFIQPD
jgi:hypothetical protein